MRLFPKNSESLRSAADDPIERKLLTCGLLRFRRIFLWAALPLVLGLVGIAWMLLSYYLMLRRGTTPATFFPKIVDIFSLYTGTLLLAGVICLWLVKRADGKLARLHALRPDEDECEDPVAAFPDPAPRKKDPDMAEPEPSPAAGLPEEPEKAERTEKENPTAVVAS
ncbi:MAG: hypothetical protein GXX91_08870 [Verrucomicrobiaceae bacterium]|nr:hypothetical protein [Verrucomicrobiaceae bacterium]